MEGKKCYPILGFMSFLADSFSEQTHGLKWKEWIEKARSYPIVQTYLGKRRGEQDTKESQIGSPFVNFLTFCQ